MVLSRSFFQLLPCLFLTLFFGFGGLNRLGDGFQGAFPPLHEVLNGLAVGIVRLFAFPVVEAGRTDNHRTEATAVGGNDVRITLLVVFQITATLLLRHSHQIVVQLPLVAGNFRFPAFLR